MAQPTDTATNVTAVDPTADGQSTLRPISATDVSVTGGFWADRLATNQERSLPAGFEQLERVGTLHNFKLAAGAAAAGDGYRALGIMFDKPFPFLDSDVYKWLEGAGWELGRSHDPRIAAMADEAIGLVEAAQRPDGYLNTFVQVLAPGTEYQDLAWGHELYCIGHLLQAALAWHRALGDERLLLVAERAVTSAVRELGPDGRVGIDGHPEIEMALVELYRATGEAGHLDLARAFIERRGHGLLGAGRFGRAYWQDHEPVGVAASVAGHAVRQMYLDCGAVDVAVETGDRALLDAVLRRWRDMVATKMYLTGALGSRHRDEAFGDPYELPPDLAYAETCAAIGSVMLARRLLLATGDPACADVLERTLYNGVLAGLSLDGTAFFYVNPLQRRTQRGWAEPGAGQRAPWYACACCPPNLMRTIASLPQMIATTDPGGVQVHQYATSEIRAAVAGGTATISIATDYPWAGRVQVTVVDTPAAAWTLSLRVPGWSTGATVRPPGGDVRPASGPTITETRAWQAGDTLTLELDLPARMTRPHPRVDAVRGTVALERGPLVYCLETDDLGDGTELEDVTIDPTVEPRPVRRTDLGGVVGLSLPARAGSSPTEVGAIPYHAWGNRSAGGMRVWVPTSPP